MSNDFFKKLFNEYGEKRPKGFYTGGVIPSEVREAPAQIRPFQKEAIAAVESNPDKTLTFTGRKPSQPEMLDLPGTRSGRWSSKCPAQSQEPRKSSVVEADFSEIEKRVMFMQPSQTNKTDEKAQQLSKKIRHAYGLPPRQMGKTITQNNDHLIATWRSVWAATIEAALRRSISDAFYPVIQDRVDEEGCGAFFNAVRYRDAPR
jgi:hypothetical protein